MNCECHRALKYDTDPDPYLEILRRLRLTVNFKQLASFPKPSRLSMCNVCIFIASVIRHNEVFYLLHSFFSYSWQPHPHASTHPYKPLYVRVTLVWPPLNFPLALSPVRILKPWYSDKEHTVDELPTIKTYSWFSLVVPTSRVGQGWVDSEEGIK